MIESNETDVDRNIKAICVTYGLRTEEKDRIQSYSSEDGESNVMKMYKLVNMITGF
jgi:hypothetical protein